MGQTIFGVGLFLGLAAFFAWSVRSALRTGRSVVKFSSAERSTQPRLFWLSVTMDAVMAIGCLYGAIQFAIDGLAH